MHNVESIDTQERAGGPDAFDGLGPETCQFVDAREMGCPKVAKWEANGVKECYCKRQSGKWC